jgi:hypothetical protein
MKMRRSFFHVKDDLRIFHFEPITKISQLMRLAEILLPANKIGFPANLLQNCCDPHPAKKGGCSAIN